MPNLLLGIIASSVQAAAPAVTAFGYMTQGDIQDGVFRWAIPADTVSTIASTPDDTDGTAGFQNTGVAGYVTQGFDGVAESDELYKLALPAETWSTLSPLPDVTFGGDGYANDGVAGYITQADGTDVVFKVALPADTITTSTTFLPDVVEENASTEDRDVAGYISEGFPAGFASDLYKWTFPTDSVSTVGSLDDDAAEGAATADPGNFALFSFIDALGNLTKVSFPTDSRSAFALRPGLFNNAAFAHPTVALYFSEGGEFDFGDPTVSDVVYKADVSTETWSTVTSAPQEMGFHSGFSNV